MATIAVSNKPIKLYSHASGPNPWKIVILLEELGIPFETEFVDMAVMHKEPFESTNPNGRVPAIDDPNTGITLWESGAIIEYLVQNYDKAGKLHYTDVPLRYYTQQYLHFQMSGQGPYFGQAAWFSLFHPEKGITSAIDRYLNEIKRVTKVLDGVLAKNNGVLVGDKITYADLSFVPWYWLTGFIEKTGELDKALHNDNPHWSKWINGLNARPAVKKAFDARMAKMSG